MSKVIKRVLLHMDNKKEVYVKELLDEKGRKSSIYIVEAILAYEYMKMMKLREVLDIDVIDDFKTSVNKNKEVPSIIKEKDKQKENKTMNTKELKKESKVVLPENQAIKESSVEDLDDTMEDESSIDDDIFGGAASFYDSFD